MKKGNDIKQDLDQAGIGLLKAARPGTDEIERVVSQTHLYESILARVNAGSPADAKAKMRVFPHLQKAAGVFAFAAVMFFVLSPFFAPKKIVHTPSPIVRDFRVSELPKSQPGPNTDLGDEIAEPDRSSRHQQRASHLSYRADAPVKRKQPAHLREPAEANVSKFYPVSFAGDPHELSRGGRVVRVELSRASLFAMGVNVPLENDSDVIKTDLLIGPDGVTRAMRFVE